MTTVERQDRFSLTASLDTVAEIPTPENVSFRYELAGPFQRFPAFFIDTVVRILAILIAFLLFGLLGFAAPNLAQASVLPSVLVLWFVVEWFYGGILECLWNGQTIGKRLMGIRVVSADGRPIDGMQAILRNLLRYLDLMPMFGDGSAMALPTFAVGLVSASLTARFQRIGDLVAGTMVVTESRHALQTFASNPSEPVLAIARQLPMTLGTTRAESAAVLAYCERCSAFGPGQRSELVSRLAHRWRERYALPTDTNGDLLMHAMYYRMFVSDHTESNGSMGAT